MVDLTDSRIHPKTREMIEHYGFEVLPVEGTLYRNLYQSKDRLPSGEPLGTAMVGLYAEYPHSVSCFHRLTHDEVWHAYGGDAFRLILLYEDGHSEEIRMGTHPLEGELVQFVVPKHTWQAGCLVSGGNYALYGCTVIPGFTGACFEAGVAEELLKKYPDRAEDIQSLCADGHETKMPEDFV